MAKKNDIVLVELREALGGDASRRSRLDRWMTENYDAFSEMVGQHRPNWGTITEIFERNGLGEEGKPLVIETVRQTWLRVRRRRGEVGKPKRQPKPKAESVGLAPGIIREVVETDAKPHVSPISPVSSAVPVSSVKPVSVVRGVGDPDEVMRKLDEQLSAGRSSMPKPIK